MDRFKFRVWFEERFIYKSLCDSNVYTEDDKCICQANNLPDLPWEQCTGLKDKNGKLIYENDIIDTPNGVYRVAVDDFGLWTAIYKGNPLKDVVEWSDIVKNYAFNRENVEIVILGNVHENKELLDE